MCDRQRPLACTMTRNGPSFPTLPSPLVPRAVRVRCRRAGGFTIRFDFGRGLRVRGFSVIGHEGIGSPICSHSQQKTVGRGTACEFLNSNSKAIIDQRCVWQATPIRSRMWIIDRFKFTSSKWRSTLTNEDPCIHQRQTRHLLWRLCCRH